MYLLAPEWGYTWIVYLSFPRKEWERLPENVGYPEKSCGTHPKWGCYYRI